jgi:hypothetical protein
MKNRSAVLSLFKLSLQLHLVEELKMVNHMCRGVCTQSPCYCIVMEFCPFGPLFNLLREGKDPWVSVTAVFSE